MFTSKNFTIYKDKVLAKSSTHTLTYDDVYRATAYWAQWARDHVPDGVVALTMPNSLEAHIILFALLQTHTLTMINPEVLKVNPDLIERLDVSSVITFDSNLKYNVNTVFIDPKSVLSYNREQTVPALESWSHDLILLSSGTTGRVMPEVIKSYEIEGYLTSYLRLYKFSPDDYIYNLLPYYHGFGLTKIFTPMATGGSYFVPDAPDFKKIVAEINDQGCTWISLVPSLARFMIKNAGELHSNFKFATVSGDIASVSLMSKFRERFGIELLAEYGCTEAAVICGNTLQEHRDGTVGKIDPDYVKVVDGEVYVQARWRPGWRKIGDYGRIDEDGYLWVDGRLKDLIKRQGKPIFPYELESHLEKLDQVSEAIAYRDDPDKSGDTITIVFVGTFTVDELTEYCRHNLPPGYQPSKIVKFDTMPRFGAKIRRKDLKEYVDKLKQ
jgi:acyl-CoA synthetase (AMP-forming)/AMP-acid ligase II